MSLELSIATLTIIGVVLGVIISVWIIKKFWKRFGSGIIYALENLLSALWNIVKFMFKVLFFCGVSWFFYYFIFGGIFGDVILSYVLSIASAIGIIFLISKIRKIHPLCMFLGHNWKYESYSGLYFNWEHPNCSGVIGHCKRKGCSATY